MKKTFITLAFAVCTMFCSNARINVFPVQLASKSYAAYAKEAFDVSLSTPKGFCDMAKTGAYTPFSQNGNTSPSCIMGAFALSGDKECLMMVGDLRFPLTKAENPDTPLNETAANFLNWTKSDAGYNICKRQHVDLSGCATFLQASKFNADTAITVTMPTNGETFDGMTYTTCTQLLIKKEGRPTIEISILLTDKGAKNAQEYLDQIFNSVKYGSVAHWRYDKDTDKAASKKHLKTWNDKFTNEVATREK